jgi:hypothetical protein
LEGAVSEQPVTLQDQIDAVTRLLDDFRWARNEPGCAEHRTWLALKEMAKDLRARLPEAPGLALAALQRRIADAAATKGGNGGLGFDAGALAGIGQEVIGRWPVVRQALERFGAEAEGKL